MVVNLPSRMVVNFAKDHLGNCILQTYLQ